jgi:MFS transporter, YQGE family, putative transporter
MKNISSILKTELYQFTSLDPNCRRLIVSNFIYSFVYLILPMIASYFIFLEFQGLDQQEMLKYNITYFVGYYGVIPLGFILNGYILRYIKINHLYIIGMAAEIFVIIPLAFLHVKTLLPLFLIGNVMGISSGLYWSNRQYMAYFVTNNDNRNYVFGLENALMNMGGFVTPLIFAFLTGMSGFTLVTLFPDLPDSMGKIILSLFLILLIIVASINILKAEYHNPKMKPFLFWKFCSTWNKQRLMNFLEGLTNGVLIVMPSLIMLHIFKDSGPVGVLQSIGILIGLIPVYLLGRFTKPRHRVHILFVGGVLLVISSIVLAVNFDEMAAMIFILSSNVVFALLWMPFLAIRMRSINLSEVQDKYEEYSYIVDIEVFCALGRVMGFAVFLAVYFYGSQIVALRYSFLIVALVPIIASQIARTIKQE